MSNLEILQTEFTAHFSHSPTHLFRAPGRVNLIGEHTDYNDGFVLPIAIDRAMLIAARERNDHLVRMVALDLHEAQAEFSLDAPIERVEKNKWSNYVRGIAWAMQERGLSLGGVDLMMHGDVPIGSGLSSSAALGVCAAITFNFFNRLGLDGVTIARLGQKSENDFVGAKTGIMDEFISALAQKDSALLIDCRDLSYQNVPLPRGVTFVVCDTSKRRGLVDSEYNTRRAECEQAAKFFGVKALRDVSIEEFNRHEKDLPPMVAKRARHIITENARVLRAVDAAKRNDIATFGKLMDASHASMRDDFQISCAELDTMVEIARRQPGCLGARLTGAGFGGCTVNLVEDQWVDAFVANVAREYQVQTGLTPQVYACRAVAGAEKLV